MNKLSEIKALYNNSWKFLVKPPKMRYNLRELSEHPTVTLGQMIYIPKTIQNRQGKAIRIHIFMPNKNVNYQQFTVDFIIYCHSQGGNAMEGSFLIKMCSELKLGLVLFDFAGSGFSEGDYITLGLYEAGDIQCVVDVLKADFKLNRLSFWGRSMGSVSILLYMNKAPVVPLFIVLDVPFYDLESTVVHFAKKKLKVPPFLMKIILNLISGKVQEEIGVNIFHTNLKEVIRKTTVPACLIASYNDEMVPFKDFQALLNGYGTKDIKMFITNKTHSEKRELEITTNAATMLVQRMMGQDIRHGDMSDMLSEKSFNMTLQESKRFLMHQSAIKNVVMPESDNHIRSSRRYSNLLNKNITKRDASFNPFRKTRETSSRKTRNRSNMVASHDLLNSIFSSNEFNKSRHNVFRSDRESNQEYFGEPKAELRRTMVSKNNPPILRKNTRIRQTVKSPMRTNTRNSNYIKVFHEENKPTQ